MIDSFGLRQLIFTMRLLEGWCVGKTAGTRARDPTKFCLSFVVPKQTDSTNERDACHIYAITSTPKARSSLCFDMVNLYIVNDKFNNRFQHRMYVYCDMWQRLQLPPYSRCCFQLSHKLMSQDAGALHLLEPTRGPTSLISWPALLDQRKMLQGSYRALLDKL